MLATSIIFLQTLDLPSFLPMPPMTHTSSSNSFEFLHLAFRLSTMPPIIMNYSQPHPNTHLNREVTHTNVRCTSICVSLPLHRNPDQALKPKKGIFPDEVIVFFFFYHEILYS